MNIDKDWEGIFLQFWQFVFPHVLNNVYYQPSSILQNPQFISCPRLYLVTCSFHCCALVFYLVWTLWSSPPWMTMSNLPKVVFSYSPVTLRSLCLPFFGMAFYLNCCFCWLSLNRGDKTRKQIRNINPLLSEVMDSPKVPDFVCSFSCC